LLDAKAIGSICVRDDLAHVKKNRLGMRKFFLIDQDESGNLQTLTNLTNAQNSVFLKNAEIYLFTNDDVYVQVEKRMHQILKDDRGFADSALPTFVPIHSYRNLISNLLVDVPLYEPLIGKQKNADGKVDLTVTVLGTGNIGTEMFLSTYWLGQILDCNLTINVLSNESEEEFWSKIDYVNPEIKRTTTEGDPLLMINRQGNMAPVYARVRYLQCDVKSSAFVGCLTNRSEAMNLLTTDYFMVSLGSDEANISVANTIRKYIGESHITTKSANHTVIAYVVYNSELADMLNCSSQGRSDVYMSAIGSLQDVYSARNVFMTDHKALAQVSYESYLSRQKRDARADAHKCRMDNNYKYWADLARGMHFKYKVFSAGFFTLSLFDFNSSNDAGYKKAVETAIHGYCKLMSGYVEFENESEKKAHITLLHRMAWLEHRRWNAFTRVKGFRVTDAYDSYATEGEMGSYKQMDLKLHPCLVECDDKGIRAGMDEKGKIDSDTLFCCMDREQFDLLDDLSYDLYAKKYNDYDFKLFDYPISDKKYWD
jgi:hypothetical protein